MKARKLGLVAVLIFFSASTPRSSYAQDSYFGDWSGVASFTETVYQNGQVVSVTTGSNIPATFGFDYLSVPSDILGGHQYARPWKRRSIWI